MLSAPLSLAQYVLILLLGFLVFFNIEGSHPIRLAVDSWFCWGCCMHVHTSRSSSVAEETLIEVSGTEATRLQALNPKPCSLEVL